MKSLSFFSLQLRRAGLGVLCGVLGGLSGAAIHHGLEWATRFREAHPGLLWGLPLAGLLIGVVFHFFAGASAAGTNLILDEIHDPQKIVPFRMAPLVLLGTIATHLFGGSAGREGVAVQMGASLADQLARVFRIRPEERKILLTAGAGAGFGAALGAPWAGMIFGMEVLQVGRLQLFAVYECLIASFVALATAHALHAPFTVYPAVEIPSPAPGILAGAALAGLAFGLAGRFFSFSTRLVERVLRNRIRYPPLIPCAGGLILVFLFMIGGRQRYAGLGFPWIEEAFLAPASILDPLLKSLFTSLTVGSGFKGGEFVPLVFIGSTLGSALSPLLQMPVGLMAALGFAAVFGGAANTPLTCTVMAMEIFGARIAPFAMLACFASYFSSGHGGIYKAQRLHRKKQEGLLRCLRWLAELPGRFLGRG